VDVTVYGEAATVSLDVVNGDLRPRPAAWLRAENLRPGPRRAVRCGGAPALRLLPPGRPWRSTARCPRSPTVRRARTPSTSTSAAIARACPWAPW